MSFIDLLEDFMNSKIGHAITNDLITDIMEIASKYEYQSKEQAPALDAPKPICVKCGRPVGSCAPNAT